ncbi:MAG: exosome complex protein Rrp42 [Nanoarchaeota archaeon]|nr:exosome complex protein Rrp42 [Nanoarchaeota archaeon]
MDNINKEYLMQILNKKIRTDGRKFEDYRDIEIETDISKNAEGSAKVRIGETEVIVGVKLEVGTPYPDNPDEGTIIVGAEFLQMANPEFESGPPSVQSVELSRVVDRGIRESKAIDFKKLCIEEGKKVWLVLIDIYAINDDGNMQDAASLAALAALSNTKMPKYDKETEKVDYKERKGKLPLSKMPIECSLAKIGEHILVDPGLDEERLLDAKLTVASIGNKIHAMQKAGVGTLKVEEVETMLKLAIEKNKKALEKINKK